MQDAHHSSYRFMPVRQCLLTIVYGESLGCLFASVIVSGLVITCAIISRLTSISNTVYDNYHKLDAWYGVSKTTVILNNNLPMLIYPSFFYAMVFLILFPEKFEELDNITIQQALAIGQIKHIRWIESLS